MCLKTKQPPMPKVPDPPKPDVAGALNDTARRVRNSQGVYSNIATSPFGDSNYGAAATGLPKLATFGGATAV